ncbi:hypothetical protein SDC9_114968 [bioreactor metagenome]|uniref:Uncharacterized protein n=1 Tax=bioreactor metagenome TaxID=1076179 RepID=A0A645BS34_9ZZZZ
MLGQGGRDVTGARSVVDTDRVFFGHFPEVADQLFVDFWPYFESMQGADFDHGIPGFESFLSGVGVVDSTSYSFFAVVWADCVDLCGGGWRWGQEGWAGSRRRRVGGLASPTGFFCFWLWC